MEAATAQLLQWIANNATPLWLTGSIVLAFLAVNGLIARLVNRADQGESRQGAAVKVIKTARFVTGFFGLLVVMVAWGIEFSSVAIVATTTITLLGVALFASWSLLSNVTAYFVLLFHPSFARGTFVRVLDGDNYVEGYVSELSIFGLELVAEDKSKVLYPNNLLLGRVTVINPPDRLNGVGKISQPATAAEPLERHADR